MIPDPFTLSLLAPLFVAIVVLFVMTFGNRKKLVKLEQGVQQQLQNLRYEMAAKLLPFEKLQYEEIPGTETVLYDGRTQMTAGDWEGNGGRMWDYTAHRFADGVGQGSYRIVDSTITLNRTNTQGRYELHLKRFSVDGQDSAHLPPAQNKPERCLHLRCRVKKGEASHVLRFVFKGENSKNVLDEKDVVVYNPNWEEVNVFFRISTAEPCNFRIDDLAVLAAPSTIEIRDLVLWEKQ